MTIFLELLSKYWKYLAIIAILCGIGLYWHNLTSTITSQKSTIDAQQQAIATYAANNKTLADSITTMNKSIDALSSATHATNQQFDTLGKKVTTQIQGLKVQQASILQEPKPTTCEDTIKYLIDAVPEYQK